MLLSADGKAEVVRLDGGPPLCVADFSYPLETMTLRPGESLVLVTDGVTEAEGPKGNFFGRDWTVRLNGLKGANARAIVEAIRDQVRAFEDGAEPTDDLTVMAIRYLGDRR